ncbi:hypothetical protein VSAK1_08316 [Vibrio mediterranei AK1]|uniref:hypothetical protein n=1 Tax=Vibrio mediterranei TaxID=689 RepID=UPI0001541DC3|nr:hypothetical protein [Vibrio mediterranei]EDL53999.1 hypothetical protein VSAK1_08316 [Vibrio mediterranei AK1]
MFELSKKNNETYTIEADPVALRAFVVPDDCLLSAILKLLSVSSTVSKTFALRRKEGLSIIIANIDLPELRRLLFTPSNDIDVDDVKVGIKVIDKLVNELSPNKTDITSTLHALLSATGFHLSSGASIKATLEQQFYSDCGGNRDKKVGTASALADNSSILHPKSPEVEVFISPGGLLETFFNNTKWSVYLGSDSTLPYSKRVEISRILRFLASQSELAETTRLFRAPPHKITPHMIYRCYKEIEATLPAIYSSSKQSREIRSFIKEVVGEFSCGRKLTSIKYQTRFSKAGIKPCAVDSIFVLQKLNDGHYLPIDNEQLDGLLTPGEGVFKILQDSESKQISQYEAASLVCFLKFVANKKTPFLQRLVKSEREHVTQAMLIDVFIELESLLVRYKKGAQRAQYSTMFRRTLLKLLNPIVGANKFHEIRFQTRFTQKGQIKCIAPLLIRIVKKDGTHSSVRFNTYSAPNLYMKKGLLAESLLAASKQSHIAPLPEKKVLHWLSFIEHFIEHYEMMSKQGAVTFLNSPLSKSGRQKVMIGLKSIENLIELRQNCDHEADFKSVQSLLSYCGQVISDGRALADLNIRSRFSPVPERTVISFKARSKTNGKLRVTTRLLDVTDIENWAPANGTLMVAIQLAAKDSLMTPPFSSVLSDVFKTIRLIHNTLSTSIVSLDDHKANQPLRYLLVSPASRLSKRDVVLGLKRLECILEVQKIKVGRLSEYFRQFLSNYGGTISNGLNINQCGFKTRLSARKEQGHQKLIVPIGKNGRPLKSPILMPFVSNVQLKRKLNEYYQKPIDAITAAIRNEFELYKKLRVELEPLIKRDDEGNFLHAIPEVVRKFVQESASGNLRGGYWSPKISQFYDRHREDLLAAFLQLRIETPVSDNFRCKGKARLINPEYKSWFGSNGSSMTPFLWSPVLLPRPILLCCFLRLIIHTNWNKDVIATLTPKDIPYPLPTGHFFIQGAKNKVGKRTKRVEVTLAQADVREAIELIGKHHANMVKLGFTPNTVWDTPWSKSLSFLEQSSLSSFRERHGLPKFRIEQLAQHMIKVREGVDGDIRRSQIERNHADVQTTAGYLDHPLARAFYDANNAEFQRQLEATVQVRYGGVKSLPEYNLSRGDINLKLLEKPSEPSETPFWFVLPDGSTCTDIWAPIDKSSSSEQLCRGRKCHNGDRGCQYNKVIIGPEELSNTLRKQRWFVERCDALLLKNTREYFDAYIAPEMRFVFGLARYIERSDPELYQQAEHLINVTTGAGE